MKKKKTKQEISKKSKFSEIIQDEEARGVLMEKGMHCFGCPFAHVESIEQGAKSHGLNADEIVEEINKRKKRK